MTELDEETLIRQFLLGSLPTEEREGVEQRLLADEEFLVRVDAVEDELTDDFALGRLSAKDRERFEQRFLTTEERRERLEFARDFHRVLSGSHISAASRAPARRFGDFASSLRAWLRVRGALALSVSLALILMCAAAVLWYVFTGNNPQRRAISATQQPKENSLDERGQGIEGGGRNVNQNNASTAEEGRSNGINLNKGGTDAAAKNTPRVPQRPRAERNQASLAFTIALTPGAVRGEGSGVGQFTIPAGARIIRIRLRLDEADDGEETSYEAELQNGEAQTIYKVGGLRTIGNRKAGRSVTLDVPENKLPAGDYQVALREHASGGNTEPMTRYYFRVKRAPR